MDNNDLVKEINNKDFNELYDLFLPHIIMGYFNDVKINFKIIKDDIGVYDPYGHQPKCHSLLISFSKYKEYIKVSLNLEDGEYVIWVEEINEKRGEDRRNKRE